MVVPILGALAAWCNLCAVVVAYLLWRDRNGHAKDERPVGCTTADTPASRGTILVSGGRSPGRGR